MNNTQKQFIDILSSGIRGKDIEKGYENVDWEQIINLAIENKVEGIVYSSLHKSSLVSVVGEKRINLLKQKAEDAEIEQLRKISELSVVIKKINKENIPLIILKGLAIRNFYPKAEQRTMGNANILVHREDVKKVKKLLIDMRYSVLEEHNKVPHHITLIHNNYPTIKIHWNLFDGHGFAKEIIHYEKLIWKRAKNVNLDDVEILSFSYEDLASHLCMYMAEHLTENGFEVRQLCDITILVEKLGNEIDWNSFIMKARMHGFEKFSLILFLICNELFDMKLPEELEVKYVNNKKYLESLIDEIFESKLKSKKVITNQFAKQVSFSLDRYSYAKNIKILTPIAWIHHIFELIFNSGHNFKDLIKVKGKGIHRSKLIDWMEL